MKFDGYYVLSDLMQIPNLSSQASSAVLRQFQKTLFGDTGGAPVVIGKQKWILLAYGIAACVWRLLVSLSLLMAASVLFHGAGLILACIGVILWFGRPLWNMLTSLNRLRLQHPERLLRASLICTSVSVVATAAMTGLPAPIMTTAPGIVDFSEGQVVRPETSGFVEVVHVKNGQEVHEGDVLISLRNDDVATRHADLQQRLAQEELRLQTASGEHDSAALNVHQVNRQSLLNQLAESTKQVSGLQIRATRAGRVAGRDLHSLKGTFAVAGKELMTIGREGEKEMQISIGQRELAVSTSLVGEELKLRIGTHSVISGTLVRVNPRGSRSIPHPALAATHGGNLAVTETPSSEQSGSEDGMRLTEHRFRAIVQLQADDARMLKCGERGTASLGWPRGSLGTYLWRSAYNWFDRQLTSIASGSPI
jgi:putative peptide zinc metalloprotease protein